MRQLERTRPLRVGLYAVGGAVAGAATSDGLWMVFGGWAPPAPVFWVCAGTVIGVLAGSVSTYERSALVR